MHDRIVYAGCGLDRAAHLRADPAWLDARLADPSTLIVPVWRDRTLFSGEDRPRPVPLRDAAAAQALALSGETAFLGLGEDGTAWFACDLSAHEEASLTGLFNGAAFRDLGGVVSLLPRGEGALLAYARLVMHWHRRHRYCGTCGSRTQAKSAGHLRVCVNPDCRVEHFPRIDPVVIMLITRHGPVGDEECLLARQRTWIPGLMSALAGFVEPGETLEEAVRREVREETGLEVADVRYCASQPWPFPSSLMLGFRAVAPGLQPLRLDAQELEDARWFNRGQVAKIRAQGLRLPFRGTIARALVEDWLAGDAASG
jgi:NAD+ diphosphatase